MARKRTLRAVDFFASLSVQPSGAMVQRQIMERRITLSDEAYELAIALCWLFMVVFSYVVNLFNGWYDFLFVGSWLDDLTTVWRYYGLAQT